MSLFRVFTSGLFIPILLLSGCKENGKEKKLFFQNGNASKHYYTVDDKIEGIMTDYYPSGEIKAIRHFENNKQSGKSTFYYQAGQIMEVQYYIDGMRIKGDTIFYEDGTLKYTSEFYNDKKNGYLRKWSETGEVTYEAKFANDTLIEVDGVSVIKAKDTTQIK
jgi:antitoxin component YwqK of YwqJK toxin-antitoxin module